jgi:hypothetical protein
MSVWESLRQEGNDFYRRREFSKAIAKYEAAIAEDPANASFICLGNIAAAHFELGKYEDCATVCAHALRIVDEAGQSGEVDTSKVTERMERAMRFAAANEHNTLPLQPMGDDCLPLVRSRIRSQFEFFAFSHTDPHDVSESVPILPAGVTRILLAGCTDMRTIMDTIFQFHQRATTTQSLELHVNDIVPSVIARQIFIMSYALKSFRQMLANHSGPLPSMNEIITLAVSRTNTSAGRLASRWVDACNAIYCFWMALNFLPEVAERFYEHCEFLLKMSVNDFLSEFPVFSIDDSSFRLCHAQWYSWQKLRVPAKHMVPVIQRQNCGSLDLSCQTMHLRRYSGKMQFETAFFEKTMMLAPTLSRWMTESYAKGREAGDARKDVKEMKGWTANPTFIDLWNVSTTAPSPTTVGIDFDNVMVPCGLMNLSADISPVQRTLMSPKVFLDGNMVHRCCSLAGSGQAQAARPSPKGPKFSGLDGFYIPVPCPGEIYLSSCPEDEVEALQLLLQQTRTGIGSVVEVENLLLADALWKMCRTLQRLSSRPLIRFHLGDFADYGCCGMDFHVAHCNNVTDYSHLLQGFLSLSPVLQSGRMVCEHLLFNNVFSSGLDYDFPGLKAPHPRVIDSNEKYLWHFYRVQHIEEIPMIIGISLEGEALNKDCRPFIYVDHQLLLAPISTPTVSRSRFLEWLQDMLFECLLPSPRFDYENAFEDVQRRMSVPGCGLGAPFFAQLCAFVLHRKRVLPHVLGAFLSDLLERGILPVGAGMEKSPFRTSTTARNQRLLCTEISFCVQDLRLAFRQYGIFRHLLTAGASERCFNSSPVRKFACSEISKMPRIEPFLGFNIEIPVLGAIICCTGATMAHKYATECSSREQFVENLRRSCGRDHLISSIRKDGVDSYSLWLPEDSYKEYCSMNANVILIRVDAWLPIAREVLLNGFTLV